MIIEQISKKHLKQILNFLNSLDKESLKFYTRWRTNFDSDIISKKIIEGNKLGKEIGFVAIINKKIIGYEHMVFQSAYRKDCVSEGGIILKEYSNRGIGSLLKKECIKKAKNLKLNKFTATVYEDNIRSIRYTLKGGYCIGGIFFNEEKLDGKERNIIYVERPINLIKNQNNYIKKLQTHLNSTRYLKNEKEIDHVMLTKQAAIKIIKEDKIMTKELSNVNELLKDAISTVISINDNNENIIVCGFIEFFKEQEKQHIGRIHIFPMFKYNSAHVWMKIMKYFIQKTTYKIEKIWLKVPETNKNLIYCLKELGFIFESVAFDEYQINSKSINSFCMALHLKRKKRIDVVKKVNGIIENNS